MADVISFVAGATGFTGREVVRLLAERKIEVVAHVRPDSNRLGEWRERFAKLGASVDTTPWTLDAMTATFGRSRPTHVFACLGTVRARKARAIKEGRDPDAESYEAVDYGLTAMLVEAAKACGSRPKIVYISAAGANKNGMSAYYKARQKAERRIIESGLDYVIARPSFIVGVGRDDRRVGERYGAGLSDGMLKIAGALGMAKLRDRYTSLTNTQLATALVEHGLAAGGKVVVENEVIR